MRRVRGAGRVVREEGSRRRQRLLLPYPRDGVIGQILIQRVALFGCPPRLDPGRSLEQIRVVLVRLPADEAVEILEAAATRRPMIERPDSAAFPHRDFVTLAE